MRDNESRNDTAEPRMMSRRRRIQRWCGTQLYSPVGFNGGVVVNFIRSKKSFQIAFTDKSKFILNSKNGDYAFYKNSNIASKPTKLELSSHLVYSNIAVKHIRPIAQQKQSDRISCTFESNQPQSRAHYSADGLIFNLVFRPATQSPVHTDNVETIRYKRTIIPHRHHQGEASHPERATRNCTTPSNACITSLRTSLRPLPSISAAQPVADVFLATSWRILRCPSRILCPMDEY